MIITLIGSVSKSRDRMIELKQEFEKQGFVVNCPCDEERQKQPLINLCTSWICKIREADLIIAIPKNYKLNENGSSIIEYLFGESTTYEMAIADYFNKRILIIN